MVRTDTKIGGTVPAIKDGLPVRSG
jgi:hypothetical protein